MSLSLPLTAVGLSVLRLRTILQTVELDESTCGNGLISIATNFLSLSDEMFSHLEFLTALRGTEIVILRSPELWGNRAVQISFL